MLTWVLTFIAFAGAAQLPPRDGGERADQVQPGTAVIRGRLVDAETGDPVSRVPVRLSGREVPRRDAVFSDAAGRFEFTGLRAGTYSLMAESSPTRPAYLHAIFREPPAKKGDSDRPATPIELGEGEIREGIVLALPRARVITGRVLDDEGEPQAGVRVEAEPVDRRSGVRRMDDTDDLGAFRLYGLAAGSYRVCASPPAYGGPDPSQISEGLVKTCYPSATVEGESTPVAVESGNADMEIRLQRSRLFTISGIVLDAWGAPAEHASVLLLTIEKHGSSGRTIERKGASFVARGVTPGNYAIQARIGEPFDPADTRERQKAYVPFRVDNANVENLLVAMTFPAAIAGRVVFEGGIPQPVSGLVARVFPDEDSERMQEWGRGPGSPVGDDLTFELKGLYGRYALGIDGLPHGWFVKSVRYRGEEIVSVPTAFESGTGPSDLVVTVSNRPARLVGRVLDDRGKPAAHAMVVLFPADRRAWTVTRTRMRRIFSRDGTYESPNLRPGEYYVAAVNAGEISPSDDREWLERIAEVAQRITFSDNDERVVELQMVSPPGR